MSSKLTLNFKDESDRESFREWLASEGKEHLDEWLFCNEYAEIVFEVGGVLET